MGRRTLAGLLAGTLLATLAACGSPKPGTFHPAGTALSGNTFLLASPASGSGGLSWPPFGSDVHIVMPSWLPGAAREKQAVITAKDFLLAFLYAEYKGGRDQRWTSYVSGGGVLDGLKSTLAAPDITTQSFRERSASAQGEPSSICRSKAILTCRNALTIRHRKTPAWPRGKLFRLDPADQEHHDPQHRRS